MSSVDEKILEQSRLGRRVASSSGFGSTHLHGPIALLGHICVAQNYICDECATEKFKGLGVNVEYLLNK
jgi:hypothetical protein